MTTPSSTGVPLAEGLFTATSEPALLGSRCGRCGTMTFPTHYGCPRCSSDDMATVELGRCGRIWTWTSQEFRPPDPYAGEDPFQPYYVGYVELPGELIVETKFVGFDERPPSIGDEVEFVLVPFRSEGDDVAVTSYAFRPIAGGTDR